MATYTINTADDALVEALLSDFADALHESDGVPDFDSFTARCPEISHQELIALMNALVLAERALITRQDAYVATMMERREKILRRSPPGIQTLFQEGRGEHVPVRPIREMRGILRGIDTTVERENDRL